MAQQQLISLKPGQSVKTKEDILNEKISVIQVLFKLFRITEL